MNRSRCAVIICLFFSGVTFTCRPNQKAPELPRVDSVAIDRITWKFDAKVPVEQFVNGDYHVVGIVIVRAGNRCIYKHPSIR